jgi:hypothetical protein
VEVARQGQAGQPAADHGDIDGDRRGIGGHGQVSVRRRSRARTGRAPGRAPAAWLAGCRGRG